MKDIREKYIHWFPGHMKKAVNQFEKYSKMVDFVIVVLDARAPISTFNDYVLKSFQNKPKLYILNKEDLADPNETKKFLSYYKKSEDLAMTLDHNEGNKKGKIIQNLKILTEPKRLKNLKKGIKNSVFKGIIVGIPNVGKSTIINVLASKQVAQVKNVAGVTRTNNWIKINEHFMMMDTPGILTPSFKDESVATKLALMGSMPIEILPFDEVCDYGLNFLKKYYLEEFKTWLNFDPNELETHEIIEQIANSRLGKLKDNKLNINGAKLYFLSDLKLGNIARITLDRLNEEDK